MRPRVFVSSILLGLALAMAAPQAASAQVWIRPLGPSTGFNDLCGEAIFPAAPNFSFSALHNPDGPDPIELTPESRHWATPR